MKTKNTSAMNLFGTIFIFLLMVSPVAFADNVTNSTSNSSGGGSGGTGVPLVNNAPIISAVSAPTNLQAGQTGTWTITATDPEGGPLAYFVVWGDEGTGSTQENQKYPVASAQAATFTHIYYSGGTFTPVFKVMDNGGLTAQTSASVNVEAKVADLEVSTFSVNGVTYDATVGVALVDLNIVFKNIGNAKSDQYEPTFYLDGAAYGPTYAYAGLAPGETKSLSGKWNFKAAPGSHTLKMLISPHGADANSANNEKSTTFYVKSPSPANNPPVITSTGGPTSLKVNEQGTWSVSAYDPEGGSLIYNVIWGDENYKAPAYPTVQALSNGQTATFQHTYYQAGTYTIKFTVADTLGATTESTITVNVNSAGQADLAVSDLYAKQSNENINGQRRMDFYVSVKNVGTATSGAFDVNAYVDGQYVSVVKGGNLASGALTTMKFDGGYYTPGTHAIKAVLFPMGPDSNSANNEKSVSFYVEPLPSGNKAPVITSTGGPTSIKVNEQGTWSVSAYDPEGKSLYYSVTWGDEGSKQPMAKQSLSQTATFQHTYYSAGSYTITIIVQDDQGATTQTTITANVGSSPQPTCQTLPLCQVGTTPQFSGYDSNNCPIYSCVPNPQPTNRAPVISGTGGPTNINTGETGTWKISAYDPENGYLSYSVNWGDEGKNAPSTASKGDNKQTATFQHTYYNAGTYTITFTVSDDRGQQAQSTLTVNVGSGKYSVDVGAYAEPSQVKVGDSFKVIGKIAYNSGPSNGAQKFKVVTKYSGSEYNVAPKANVKFSSLEDDVVATLNQYFYGKTPAQVQIEKPSVPPSTTAGSSSASGGATAVASAIEEKVASELGRVDYVVLRPGESTSVSAYFTARSAGTKYVTASVYKEMPLMCVAAPCPSEWRLVGQSTTKISVVGSEQPPSPPSEGTIKLYKGWNMVSVPVGSTVSMKEVSAECNSKPYAWKLTSSGYSKEYTLYPGVGYWIKSSGECEFDVSESTTTGQAVAVPELFAGWNLVAAPENAVSISDYAGTCSISQGPWYYSHETGKPKPEYVYSSTLEPSRAYWVNVPAACTLGSVEDKPPAPPQSSSTSGSGGSTGQ
jgi:hypothetical protein